jgi:methionyl-tRNA synthetase
VKSLDSGLREKIESFRLNQFVEETLELVRATNRFVEHNKPWELAKNKQAEKLNQVLYVAAEVLRQVSVLLSPIIPEKCAEIQRQIGIARDSVESKSLAWNSLKPGTPISSGDSLFPRLVVEKSPEPDSATPKISYDDFARIELKTARVLEAERVKGADKLLRLQIELGSEKRQIVAGIAQHYSPEQLVGKTISVVANLVPAKIRGVESNGMLLAAKSDDRLVLLTSDADIPSGCKIS